MNSKRGKSTKRSTPIRAGLNAESSLHARVQDGLSALAASHKAYVHEVIRSQFSDSMDLDEAMKKSHPDSPRWDYLLGHHAGLVALEPHSAKTDEVSLVIRKRKEAESQLRPHLKPGVRVARWLWVASGRVQFADTERQKLLLDQEGITFVGKQVAAKHLPRSNKH
jgi:hypothetical protein